MKAAIIVLADNQTLGDLGRVANALTAVQEFKQHGDEVKLIFDGAGTRWIQNLSDPEHKYHDVFEAVRDKIDGVCQYCAAAYQVTDSVKAANLPLSDDYEGHPSFRTLIRDGYAVVTF